MSQPKTTYEDLAKLGHAKTDILRRCNELRGGTMQNESQLHVNDGLTDHYGWYSWNGITGPPTLLGVVPKNLGSTQVSHVWDNSANDQEQKDEWDETTTTSTTARLTTTNSASITLSASVTVLDVASSGFSITVGTEEQKENTSTRSEEKKNHFEINVGPHERLELHRMKTELGQQATYAVPFGLTTTATIGTEGGKYNDHYHWAYNLNSLLGNPTGNILLTGVASTTSHTFKMIRTRGSGRVVSTACLFISGNAVEIAINDSGSPDDRSDVNGVHGY